MTALCAAAAGIGPHPHSCRAESVATGRICNSAEDSDDSVTGGDWSIESPGCAALHCFVGAAAAVHHRRTCVDHIDCLTTRAAVAAGIRSLPGACCIESGAAMTSSVGHCAENRDYCAATIVCRRWSIESPGGAQFDSLIGAAAGNDWRSGIDYGHFLTAGTAVATGIGSLPCPSRIKGGATVTRCVSHCADDPNGGGTAGVRRNGSVECPWGPLLDCLRTCTCYDGSDKINHHYCLTALRAIAATINRLPGAGRAQGVAATRIGDGADDDNSDGAAVICGGGQVKRPVRAALNNLIGNAA